MNSTTQMPYQRETDSFYQCFDALGESHNQFVFDAIERLVQAGEQVGFTGRDLVRMLKGGMSLETLFDVIEVRMTGTCPLALKAA
jgi:hypothetical protein